MKRLVLLFVLLPLLSLGQPSLTGVWRLKESRIINGANYINAIPTLINIEQKPEVIVLEATSDLGDKDTLIKESLYYGGKAVNRSTTKMGKRKIVRFQKTEENTGWLKQTEIFTKEDSTKLQSVNRESFTLGTDGNTVTLLREYDNIENSKDNNSFEDFTYTGFFEKITPEQLAKETAIGNGINFTEGLTWEQVKAKAKKENKYIFVDCYATWCIPCKVMDRKVYPLNMVGDAMNEFVSVKVQMDSTKNDSPQIKMLYSLARKLEKEYTINSLPTYFFFSPNGKAIHKGIGKKGAKDFIELVNSAKDSQKQLYTLFERAKQKKIPWREYPDVVKRLKEEFREEKLANEIAGIYYQNNLSKMTEKELLTKNNIDFIGRYLFLVKTSDKIFQLSFKNPTLIDSIAQYQGGSWANLAVNLLINREEVQPEFEIAEKENKTPDWEKLEQQLTKKYSKELANTYVLDARLNWFEKKKDWVSFLRYLRPQLACHDLKKVNPTHLNKYAWHVFKHSVDITLMKEALQWTDIAIEKYPKWLLAMVLDTKACLLYKIGKREEGIAMMIRISQMHPDQSSHYQPRINSMIKGEDIWLTF